MIPLIRHSRQNRGLVFNIVHNGECTLFSFLGKISFFVPRSYTCEIHFHVVQRYWVRRFLVPCRFVRNTVKVRLSAFNLTIWSVFLPCSFRQHIY